MQTDDSQPGAVGGVKTSNAERKGSDELSIDSTKLRYIRRSSDHRSDLGEVLDLHMPPYLEHEK